MVRRGVIDHLYRRDRRAKATTSNEEKIIQRSSCHHCFSLSSARWTTVGRLVAIVSFLVIAWSPVALVILASHKSISLAIPIYSHDAMAIVASSLAETASGQLQQERPPPRHPLHQRHEKEEEMAHDRDNDVNNNDAPLPPVVDAATIAHVVSLINCHKAERVKGYLDALVMLRHSIHRNSIHGGTGHFFGVADDGPEQQTRSKYDYQMVALVHTDGGCVEHVPLLRRLGYDVLLRDTPVDVDRITTNDWYKDHVAGENCCGAREFVKLYAYTLMRYPIVVHWDLDTALLQPMDDLFDAMLYDKDSAVGRAARGRLHVQHPTLPLPDRIDAFFTRDITSARPWERVTAVQGGLLVARPSLEHFERYRRFIMEANYTPGRGPTSGWGGLGYGGFQGAMAYQGVLAYFYDQLYPGRAVELDVCRWNNVVADVIWRGPERPDLNGTCRQHPLGDNPTVESFLSNRPEFGKCEDCRILPLEETMSVHFTACKKPWDCTVPYPRVPNRRNKEHSYRLANLTNKTTCKRLFQAYFGLRREFEQTLRSRHASRYPMMEETKATMEGSYEPEYFGGYCNGGGDYISIQLPETFNATTIYGS